MRRILLVIAAVVLACGVVGAQELKDIEEAYLKIVRKVRPSVVAIKVYKTSMNQLGNIRLEQTSTTEFSGIVVTKEGHIATIAKGISGASRIYVETIDGQRSSAELVGVDDSHSVGIIKVRSTKGIELTPAEFGDSDDLEVGSLVVVVGCPSGMKHSVVYGSVSGLDRVLASPSMYYTGMIQLSNPVSHSDPGGLVANSEGKIVGMVAPAFIKTPSFRRVEELVDALQRKMAELAEKLVKKDNDKTESPRQPRVPKDRVKRAIIRPSLKADLYDPALSQGINFALPINTVKQVCDRIIYNKKQPWLGVRIRELKPTEKTQITGKGLIILQVVPNSPAMRGGLKTWDILVRVGEKELNSDVTLRKIISASAVGDELTFRVLRKKEELEIKIKLGERE